MPLFELTTVEPIARIYQVEADSEEDARRRFALRHDDAYIDEEASYYVPVQEMDMGESDEVIILLKPLPKPEPVKPDSSTVFDIIFSQQKNRKQKKGLTV